MPPPGPLPTPPASAKASVTPKPSSTPKPSGTIHCAAPSPLAKPMPAPPRPSVEANPLPTGTSPSDCFAHIASIQETVNEHMNEIETIKTANAALKRKIDSLNQQLPEAEKDIEDKVEKKLKMTMAVAQAQKVADDIRKSTEEFEKKVQENNELEEKRQKSVQNNQNLIKMLRNMAKNAQVAALTKAGKYMCDFCGTVHRFEEKTKHDQKCWGRCVRCARKGFACDCGASQSFAPCTNCRNKRFDCKKIAGRREDARQASIIKEQS